MMWSHFAMVTMVYSNGANNKIKHFRRGVNPPILFSLYSQSGHWQGPRLTWNSPSSLKPDWTTMMCTPLSYMMWSHFSMATMEHYNTAHSSVSIWHAQCSNYKWSPCLHITAVRHHVYLCNVDIEAQEVYPQPATTSNHFNKHDNWHGNWFLQLLSYSLKTFK